MTTNDCELDVNRKLQLFKTMYTIRCFEKTAGRLYQRGLVKGGIHACIGQEAVAVGVCASLRDRDFITSTHRGHGHHIARGADPGKLMAELLGKITGYCGGRGGSMHVAAFDVGSLGAFPIVGAGIPPAVGAALSAQIQGLDSVAVTFFGEGAMAQGVFHESLNMAAIWQLPVIFVCENNQYAVSTRSDQSRAFGDVIKLVEAYGIPGEEVDGQNVLAVFAAATQAVDRARSGMGPGFIHARTYRFEGHYFGEPETYRSRDEVKHARDTMDPISLFRDHLLHQSLLSESELQAIVQAASDAIDQALKLAESSPEPPPEEYMKYVLC
ncbi:MAG: thiamine pyrophosphate-dependent dehydrogenase E1 component subunit alpha [Anaerolineales bacterium]|nr:thiamine pyrophosphate-dependent dehydrogenase E1 component subunit alpha [Anaerolineales bacterium]